MTWFRVDDKFHDHPKVRKLRGDKMPAAGLWSLAGSWAADNLTDGFVPTEIVRRFDPRERYARKLVEVGLWVPGEHDGEPGYHFHEWPDYQPTRSEVQKQRDDGRDRVRRWRERNERGQLDSVDAEPVTNGHRNALRNALVPHVVTVPPTLPGSTQPKPNSKEKSKPLPSEARQADSALDRFGEFWTIYPRLVARGHAEKAWRAAIKAKVDPQSMIDAATAYAASRRGKDSRYTKYPASWLNGKCYLDEPESPTELRLASSNGYRPYSDPPDSSIYHQGFQ
jgi:hypothetical protein